MITSAVWARAVPDISAIVSTKKLTRPILRNSFMSVDPFQSHDLSVLINDFVIFRPTRSHDLPDHGRPVFSVSLEDLLLDHGDVGGDLFHRTLGCSLGLHILQSGSKAPDRQVHCLAPLVALGFKTF